MDMALHAAMTEPSLAALSTRGLSVSYRGQTAVADVTLAAGTGRITALIGPSGCGKSSFLASLNRITDLIPGCEVRGEARIGDTAVHAPGTDVIALRRRVGMIFQQPNPFPLSIRRNLDLPLREHGIRRRAEREAMSEKVLREVGLWDEVADRLDRPAQGLSGGQQQRLCIARALVLRPDLLLLDEPCSALDPISSRRIEELILELRGRYTLLIVTHNLAQARRIADAVGVFWWQAGCGRLIEFGSSEQVFTAPQHSQTAAYLQGRQG